MAQTLIDLRKRILAMLPRVDLPELLLEVMGRVPAFEAAFTSVAGGVSKLADFHVSVAACLTAQALNIGYAPVVKAGTLALERGRLSHVAQNYLSAETYTLANGPLIDEQGQIGFGQRPDDSRERRVHGPASGNAPAVDTTSATPPGPADADRSASSPVPISISKGRLSSVTLLRRLGTTPARTASTGRSVNWGG